MFTYKWNSGSQMVGDKNIIVSKDIGTIEVCFSGAGVIWLDKQGICLRTNGKDSNIATPINRISIDSTSDEQYSYFTNDIPAYKKISISANKKTCLIDGLQLSHSDMDTTSTQVYGAVLDTAHIGTNENMYGSLSSFVGTLYCIRIYDRHLTEKEVIHNYEIDKERFGI